MAPKRTIRSRPAQTTPPLSSRSSNLKEMIDQGVTAALAARGRNTNGDDSHVSGTCVRRIKRVTRDAITWVEFSLGLVGLDVAYAYDLDRPEKEDD
ncbi:hypothetical protein Tco_0621526 [Tanacetum coccineum]